MQLKLTTVVPDPITKLLQNNANCVMVPDPITGIHSIEVCARLKSVYEEIAKRRGTLFLAAGDYVVVNDADEEHMDEEGHAALANAVEDAIRKCY